MTYSNSLKLDYDIKDTCKKGHGLFNFYFYIWKYFANKVTFRKSCIFEIKSIIFIYLF